MNPMREWMIRRRADALLLGQRHGFAGSGVLPLGLRVELEVQLFDRVAVDQGQHLAMQVASMTAKKPKAMALAAGAVTDLSRSRP